MSQFKGQTVRVFAPVRLAQAHPVPADVGALGFKPVAPVAEKLAALTKTEQTADKAQQITVGVNQAPIKPTDLVVLAVGVVVALLGRRTSSPIRNIGRP